VTARVDVTTEVVASPRPNLSLPSGQAFILGQTQTGPIDKAVRVTGLADYQAIFGDRSGGTSTYDTIEMAFKEGLAQAWVVRLAGPAALAASKAVGTLTVTATSPGAWGNALSVGWVNAAKSLTINGTGYPGADLATLQAALRLGAAPVTITGTVPTADVAAAPLTGGTDDAANAVLADRLALFSASLGDGAVSICGKTSSQVNTALAAHCQATGRHGIISAASGSTLAQALTELVALTDPSLHLEWPDVTAGSKTYPAASYALGKRAAAHATGNPLASPISPRLGTARFATGVLTDITDAEWKTANKAGLSVIRSINGQVRQFGWRSVAAPGGVLTMQGANYRDLICRVQVGCQQIADDFAGEIADGTGLQLQLFASRLTAFMASLAGAGALYAKDGHPGYVVDVGPGVNPVQQIANGLIKARVGFLAAGTMEFFSLTITGGDAAGTL
jgi:hypothetical protein